VVSTAPPAPAVFVGRSAELDKLVGALGRVPLAVVYGVGGMGKSALCAAAAARVRGEGAPLLQRTARGEALSALLDDLRRALAAKPVAEHVTEEQSLEDLCQRLDAAGAVLVVDDVHTLTEEERRLLVIGLAGRLTRARALVSSRERVPLGAGDPDRFELRLGGLDDDGARELWRNLDDLYGAVAGMDQAVERARGNPFLLRRAHAGGLHDEHPIEAAVAALAGDERRVSDALALAGVPLSLEALARALDDGDPPDARARAAVRSLARKLVVDVDGAGRATLHDLFREALVADLAPAAAAALHGKLALAVERLGLPLPARVRESVRHLGAAGRFADAGALLVASGPELVRMGATSELLRGLESIPEAHRTSQMKLALARCRVRGHQLLRARDELRQLDSAGAEPRHEVRYSLATVVYSTGDAIEGLELLRQLLEVADLDPALRLQIVTQHAWGLTSSGRSEEGVALLDAEAKRAPDGTTRALLAFYRAGAHWAAEQLDDMAEALAQARALSPSDALPYASGSATRLLFAAMLARLGRTAEARAILDSDEAADSDPHSQANERRMRALIHYELGERVAALALFREAAAVYWQARNVVTALVCDAWVARTLLLLGRRAEAQALLAATEAAARERGLLGAVHTCDRARRLDPMAPAAPEDARPTHGDAVRLGALAAVRRAAAGHDAARLIAETRARAAGEGFGLDRALAAVAEAFVQRRAGADDGELLARARGFAAEDGADQGLVDGVVAELSTPGNAVAPLEVVLDGRSHELRVGERVIPLRRRAALRRLLYGFAHRPGAVLDKEQLARCLWNARYDPDRHDGAIWVNIRRLRQLLEGSGISVELDEEGYLLSVPRGFAFVQP
jgi:tetratricopeptide (TPR) repeat protein